MRLPARAAVFAALTGVAAACATAPDVAVPRAETAAIGRLSAAERERLNQLAADYLARADRAAARADHANEPTIAAEHAATAELLFQAAKYEAERIELERQLLAEELRRDVALRALAAERYAILAIRSETMVAGAAQDPRSHTAPPSASELTRRARLRIAAARALGAEAGQLAEAERQVRQAGERPEQARAALELAERVLARARASR